MDMPFGWAKSSSLAQMALFLLSLVAVEIYQAKVQPKYSKRGSALISLGDLS